MQTKITGLKIENGILYNTVDKTGKFEETSTNRIAEIEELVRRLERFTYPMQSIKENIIFENEYKTGAGFVKGFKDKDGDVIYTVQPEKEKELDLDEEDAFGLDYLIPFVSNTTAAPNYWGKIHNAGEECTKRRKREVEDISNQRPRDIKMASVPREPESIPEFTGRTFRQIPSYSFEKRVIKKREDPITIEREAMKKLFLTQNILISNQISGDKIIGKSSLYSISYKSPKDSFIKTYGMDGNMISNIIKYNKRNNILGTNESLFYLKESNPSIRQNILPIKKNPVVIIKRRRV